MRRRAFLLGSGAATAGLPIALAQDRRTPVIGYLHSGSPPRYVPRTEAFLQSMSAAGYVDGKSVTIEYRWAGGDYSRLPALAADLVGRRVDVLLAVGGVVGPVAKAATSTIPIVFISGADPVAQGLVASFARPGGNATGVSFMTLELGPKRLGLLSELAPAATEISVLINDQNRDADTFKRELEQGLHKTGKRIRILVARNPAEIDKAFAGLTDKPTGALSVHADPVFTNAIPQVTALSARTRLPTIFPSRDFVLAGGLIGYGADIREEYRQAGAYVARILKGEKPAELPVVQPTKFELVINLKTAAALGIEIPPMLLAQANEVIE
jgi:putative ABC transport system substrate-binding protein